MRMAKVLTKIFDKTISYGFYALFFLVPLLFNTSRTFPSYELFEWNKMMFVYLMTVIIVSAWIGKMLTHRKIIFQKTPLDIPLGLFLLSQSLATFFSIDRHVSFFGYYSRFHGGLLSTICYLLLFYALVSNKNLLNLKKLAIFILASSLAVVIYGILEKFGIDAHMWVQDVRSRVFSTFGQPNWLAAYLAILLPFTIVNVLQKFNSDSENSNSKIQSFDSAQDKKRSSKFKVFGLFSKNFLLYYIPYTIYYILLYTCLLFTKSRSGFLGFWGANLIFWLGIFIFNCHHIAKLLKIITTIGIKQLIKPKKVLDFFRSKHHYLKIFLFINIALFICNFIFLTPFPNYNKFLTYQVFNKNAAKEETKAPVGDSVINVGITDSADIRKIVWQGALDIAKAYPFFGTGPETFAYAYYKYRPTAHNMTSEWDFLYNKAHNEYLNFAATSGFLGLGIYLLLIIWTLLYMVREIISTPKTELRIILFSLLSSYVSILITNFFGFSVVVIGLYFFLIPAFTFILTNQNKSIFFNPQPINFKKSQLILLFILCLTVLYLIVSLSKFWLADSYYAKSLSLDRQEDYTNAYKHIYTATNLRNSEPVFHDERASIAGNLALLAFENENATLSARLALEALNESAKALKISPQNINFWKTRTRILFSLSEINPQFTQTALESILVTQALAPTDAKIAYNVAIISGRADKNQEAIQALVKAIELKPDYRDAYIALSLFYSEAGQKDKAKQMLEQILQKINPDDQEVKARLEKM